MPWRRRKLTSKRDSTSRSTSRAMCVSSVVSLRTNLRRAGTLKNRSRTSMVVPGGCAAGRTLVSAPPSTSSCAACSAPAARETIRSRDTEPIEGSASPRKPSVVTASRSSSEAILLVACRASAIGSSPAAMPQPSSRTRTSATPPRSMSISMRVAPASSAFSTSSLTTEAGRSITSPAAIWSTSSPGRMRIPMQTAVYRRSEAPSGRGDQGVAAADEASAALARVLRRSCLKRVPSGGFSMK